MSDVVPETEIAWAAGFFDGEGTITTAPNGTGPKLYTRISVAQSDPRPLARFAAAVGVGKVYRLSPRPGIRQEWTYSIASQAAVGRIVELLWPYLSEPKREQIQNVQGRESRRIAALGQQELTTTEEESNVVGSDG